MALGNKSLRTATLVGIVGAALAAACGGCSKSAAPEAPKAGDASLRVEPGAEARDSVNAAAVNFEQRFEDAVITEVLDGHHLPPDLTAAGKKTAPVRVAVEKSWASIKLTDAAGKPIPYTLQVETADGPFEITLRPDIAPNHVRNFLALVQAGFYDGLQFERIVRQEVEIEGTKSRLDLILAGCPTGTGDDGYGHIGYFVRAEARPEVKHEAGTVGFWHEEDPDSAGCRFYITLGPAPILDGKFTVVGKVTSGLDVVRKIGSAPVQSPDSSPENEKPLRPVTIKKVTAAPAPGDKTTPTATSDTGGN